MEGTLSSSKFKMKHGNTYKTQFMLDMNNYNNAPYTISTNDSTYKKIGESKFLYLNGRVTHNLGIYGKRKSMVGYEMDIKVIYRNLNTNEILYSHTVTSGFSTTDYGITTLNSIEIPEGFYEMYYETKPFTLSESNWTLDISLYNDFMTFS